MKYGSIISDPKSQEARNLVGKKVVGSVFFGYLSEHPEEIEPAIYRGAHPQSSFPFLCGDYLDDTIGYTFIREVIEDEKVFLTYESIQEMTDDFKARFLPGMENMPMVWLKHLTTGKVHLVTVYDMDSDLVLVPTVGFQTMEKLLKDYVYLDGTPVGKEV